MDTYKEFITKTFNSFKCKEKYHTFKCIPIYNKDDLKGYLTPITKDFKSIMPYSSKLLALWRNENPFMTVDPFLATEESTQNWIENLIINRDDRILFLVTSLRGKKIGHMGYSTFDFDKKSCEVDAVLRGVKDNPGIMSDALQALIYFGKNTLKLDNIFLRVFSDNYHAIKFYENNGFKIVKKNIKINDTSLKTYTIMKF